LSCERSVAHRDLDAHPKFFAGCNVCVNDIPRFIPTLWYIVGVPQELQIRFYGIKIIRSLEMEHK